MNKNLIFKLILIVLATGCCYFPSLSNGLTNWDDQDYAVNNPMVKRPSWESAKTVFTKPFYGAYQPLVLLSFAVDKNLGHQDPSFSHGLNLLLHILNTLLVFWLILKLASDPAAALLTALLFGLHPLHVESVAWAAERKDVLYSLFFLASAVSYLYHLEKKDWGHYFLCLFLFVLSALSKGMAVVLPALLVLFDHHLGFKPGARDWLKKAPLFAIALVFGVAAVKSQHPGGFGGGGLLELLWDNLLAAGYGFLFYPIKMLWPLNLSAVYPVPEKQGGTLTAIYYAALPAAAVVTAAVLVFARKNKDIIFGFLFYAIAILPVLRMLPFGVSVAAADRFAYISSIGLLYLAAMGLLWLTRKAEAGGSRIWRPLAWGLVAGIAVWWGALTFSRNLVWRDSITLWSDVVMKQPGSALAYSNLGQAYMVKAEYDSAVKYCTRAIGLDQKYHEAYYARSCAYKALGLVDQAYDDVSRAIALNPREVCSYNNRGIIYEEMGFYLLALEDYTRAIKIDPSSDEPYFNRGNVYQKTGNTERALADYAMSIRLNPGYADVYNNRGNVYHLAGRKELALADYNLAIKLNPGHADAHNNRGLLLASGGQYQRAAEDFTAAINLNPGRGTYYNNRAEVLMKMGRSADALIDLNKARMLGHIAPVNKKQP